LFGIESRLLRLSLVLAMVSMDEVGASFFLVPFSMLSLARAFSSTSRDAIRFSTNIFLSLVFETYAKIPP
jgi:hypothetical protein